MVYDWLTISVKVEADDCDCMPSEEEIAAAVRARVVGTMSRKGWTITEVSDG